MRCPVEAHHPDGAHPGPTSGFPHLVGPRGIRRRLVDGIAHRRRRALQGRHQTCPITRWRPARREVGCKVCLCCRLCTLKLRLAARQRLLRSQQRISCGLQAQAGERGPHSLRCLQLPQGGLDGGERQGIVQLVSQGCR